MCWVDLFLDFLFLQHSIQKDASYSASESNDVTDRLLCPRFKVDSSCFTIDKKHLTSSFQIKRLHLKLPKF